jgi:hypothetical protein
MSNLCRCGCGTEVLNYYVFGHASRVRQNEENGSAWKGDDVGYNALHHWVRKYGTKTGHCSHCGREGYTEWANVSGEYRRDLDDFIELCVSCHRIFDGEEE